MAQAEYIDALPGFNRKQHDIKVIDGELRFKLGSFKPDGTPGCDFCCNLCRVVSGPLFANYNCHPRSDGVKQQSRVVLQR